MITSPGWTTALVAFTFWVMSGGPAFANGAWEGRKQRTRDACAAATVLLGAGAYVLAWVLVARRHPS